MNNLIVVLSLVSIAVSATLIGYRIGDSQSEFSCRTGEVQLQFMHADPAVINQMCVSVDVLREAERDALTARYR